MQMFEKKNGKVAKNSFSIRANVLCLLFMYNKLNKNTVWLKVKLTFQSCSKIQLYFDEMFAVQNADLHGIKKKKGLSI